MWLYTTPQSYNFFLKLARISEEKFRKSYFGCLADCHYALALPWDSNCIEFGTIKADYLAYLFSDAAIISRSNDT